MTVASAQEGFSPIVIICIAGGLFLTALGELAAIRFGSAPLALLIVLWCGAAFCWLAWYRLSLAIVALFVALPLITVEIGLDDVAKTLSTDKSSLAAVVGVGLLLRLPAVWSRLIVVRSVRWWIVFLGATALSSLRNGLTVDQVWGFLEQGVYAGVFLATLAGLEREPIVRRRLLAAAGLAGGAVGGLTLIEWVLWSSGNRVPLYYKHGTVMDAVVAGSTIAHVNHLGGYLILVIPILVAMWSTADRSLRPLIVMSILLAGGALLYAKSIGAWMGLALAGVLAVSFTVRASWPRAIRVALGVVCVGIILIGTGVTFVKLTQDTTSVYLRLAAYRVGWAAITERPLLGFGRDGYQREHVRLERIIFGHELSRFREIGSRLSAHSSFLDVAVERGLVGLTAFIGLLAAVLMTGIRGYICATDVPTQRILLGLLTGLVAFIVQAFSENLFSYSKVAAIFWIMAATTVRMAEARPSQPS